MSDEVYGGIGLGFILGVIVAAVAIAVFSTTGRSVCEDQFKGDFINGKCYKPVIREEMK